MHPLTDLIDLYLEDMKTGGTVMITPDPHIPKEMIDPTGPKLSDWTPWKPIASVITDSDISAFEKAIKHSLPQSFQVFLKYKHFYQLKLPDQAVGLRQHLPDHELRELRRLVFDSFDPDQIIGRGYIYFADFNDYGLLCFDTNQKRDQNEYPVVYMDHDMIEDVHPYADNFCDLLTGDTERGNRFIDFLNELYK